MDNALIYSEDGHTIISCDITFEGELIIPDGVDNIAEKAFCNCKRLTSIIIPNSVKNIGNWAFYKCSGLTYVDIPNSVTSIGLGAFNGCSGLKSVTIPNSVTSIKEDTFYGCSGLISIDIPNSVTNIDDCAFYECSSLISVNIPNSVTSIGDCVMYGTAWFDAHPDGIVYIGLCAYAYKGTMPKGTSIIIKEGTKSIEDAFVNCSWLASVDIPNSVTSIGNWAFYNCSGLTSVDIPNSVISIGARAFENCSGLTSVKIPNSVTSIGTAAFSGCSGLTSVDIPNSVISIGTGALEGCTGLISVFLPCFIKSITEDVFFDCPNLKNIYIPKGSSAKFVALLPELKDKMVEQELILTKDTKDRLLLFFFDTETTGLPRDWEAPSSDVTNWPRIVQISWIVSNVRGQIISRQNYIVKPEGFSIPPELAKVHGITTERALEEGEKLNNILDHFLRDIQQVSFIVGHNISFDKNVVAAEIYRKGNEKHLDENCIDKYVDMLETKPTICTMLSSTNFCRIPRYDNGYKWPKLSELYYKLFNKELVDAHDSSVDVQATFDCFWRLKELGIIGNIDIEDNVIQENEQCVHINKIRFTTFLFNSSIFSGYGGSTSDFSKRLITYEWKLYVSNEKPQDLMFCYPQTLHIMDNGRGINGTYSLKDNNSLLLSMDGESLYLHCVYYNEEIIIFQFDQSNEHLLLYQKHLVFSSVNDINTYFIRVKEYVDTQRKNARKQKEIELIERADSLVRDIERRDIEISDKRVESLKMRMKQLCSIIGPEEANKYQPIIDNAIKANEDKKRIVEEEKREKEEERKRKKTILIKKISIRLVVLLYAGLWITARYYHFTHEWETCLHMFRWASVILFFGTILWFCSSHIPQLPLRTKVVHTILGIITILCYFAYDDDWHKFRSCFIQDVINRESTKRYTEDNFSIVNGDRYLSRTTFHFFDSTAKEYISRQIEGSKDLIKLNRYVAENKSGYYLEESKGEIVFAANILCSTAETMGDWKYIIDNAPEKYRANAEKEYAKLDSIVWKDEYLAYRNAKSLNTIEAYEKYLSLYGKGEYGMEITASLIHLKQLKELLEGSKKYKGK